MIKEQIIKKHIKFDRDLENFRNYLSNNIKNAKILIIGGAGTIGSSYIKQVLKYKPDIIITGLVAFTPCILKFLFKDFTVINSIEGYPKFNLIRKFIWKMFH